MLTPAMLLLSPYYRHFFAFSPLLLPLRQLLLFTLPCCCRDAMLMAAYACFHYEFMP